jgi:hypothetical protein
LRFEARNRKGGMMKETSSLGFAARNTKSAAGMRKGSRKGEEELFFKISCT